MNRSPVGVQQPRAFAAQRLRQQERRRPVQLQRGRMELHELDVLDLRARAVRDRHAVARRHLGIRRIPVHRAEPAGRQQDRARAALLSVAPETAPATSPSSTIRSVMAAKLRNVTFGSDAALWYRVRAISRPVESPCACRMRLRLCAPSRVNEQLPAFAIELRAPVDQLLDGRRAFFHQRAHRRRIAQAIPGVQRVLLVQAHVVVVAERDRDAALRVLRRRFAQAVLRDHEHLARVRQFDGGAQSGHARADHQKVRIHPLLR